MATLLTGATGYLGSYLAAGLLERGERLNLLVRAKSTDDAERRLWRALQLHMDFKTFDEHRQQLALYLGDLTAPGLGLDSSSADTLVRTTDSVVHCAAALNRTSERACLLVNLKGTLSVAGLAGEANRHHGLRRFTHVSTVSVAGERLHEDVGEDEGLDWSRRDYDAYSRTKKFAEHMVRELLADVPKTIARPSIVLGDSRFGRTTQFDMVRAFSMLAALPILPLRPRDRIDIVPANWVANAIVTLHLDDQPAHETYHLSSGAGAETYREITSSLSTAMRRRPPVYLPWLETTFERLTSFAASAPLGKVRAGARLLHVFYPYLTYDTVFDNARAAAVVGPPPTFSSYCAPLLDFARRHRFVYPYEQRPARPVAAPTDAGATIAAVPSNGSTTAGATGKAIG